MPEAPGYAADRAFVALLETLDEGVLVFDEAQRCRSASRRAGEMLGLDARSLVGRTRAEVIERVAAAAVDPSVVAALAGDAISNESTVADPIALGGLHPRTLVWTSTPIVEGGSAVGRLDVLRDVTRERRAEAAADEMAKRLELVSTIDDLTGLVNRRRFQEECQREHRRAQREWISYAVARFDVDGMKGINQAIGREQGDELLRRLGDELKSARREYDVVARWMDDEFVVLLPRADGQAAKGVVERALAGAHEKGREIAPGMTLSAGVAIWTPPSGEGPADIVQRAGEALVAARAKGPGSMEIHVGTAELKDEMTEG